MSAATKARQAAAAPDRRVRRTQRALREAFISLVLERGYADVTVEDITDRADVARATFYAHYDDKEHLLSTLFEDLTTELISRLPVVSDVPDGVRTEIVVALYEHAAEYRDLYRVCLRGAGNGSARAGYLDVITRAASLAFAERVRVDGLEPPVDLQITSRAFAGIHLVLLDAWLDDDRGMSPEQMARTQLRITTYGLGWALGMVSDDAVARLPKLEDVPVREPASA